MIIEQKFENLKKCQKFYKGFVFNVHYVPDQAGNTKSPSFG